MNPDSMDRITPPQSPVSIKQDQGKKRRKKKIKEEKKESENNETSEKKKEKNHSIDIIA